jgi:hypothetical protein
MTVLRALHRSLSRQQGSIGTLCDENKYALQFLISSCKTVAANPPAEEGDSDDDE